MLKIGEKFVAWWLDKVLGFGIVLLFGAAFTYFMHTFPYVGTLFLASLTAVLLAFTTSGQNFEDRLEICLRLRMFLALVNRAVHSVFSLGLLAVAVCLLVLAVMAWLSGFQDIEALLLTSALFSLFGACLLEARRVKELVTA